jgi:hypothetical protein
MMSLPDVKYYRPYYGPQSKKGTTEGADVLFVKWVLIRAGLMLAPSNGIPDNKWNGNAVRATKTLQKQAGIAPITGNMGPATFEALRSKRKKGSKTEYAWDAFRIKGYNTAVEDMQVPTEAEVRAFISGQLYVMYAHRDAISYSQNRAVYAIVNRITNPALARKIDCSGTSIYGGALADWNYRKEGIRVPPYDPTYGNSGYGNTWSLKTGGKRITRSEVKVGDLVFYTGHVATVVHRSGDSINVVSMGSNKGPLYLPDDYRSDIEMYRTYDLHEEVK